MKNIAGSQKTKFHEIHNGARLSMMITSPPPYAFFFGPHREVEHGRGVGGEEQSQRVINPLCSSLVLDRFSAANSCNIADK